MRTLPRLLIAALMLAGCRPGGGPQGAGPKRERYDPKQGLPGEVRAYYELDLTDPAVGFFDQPWPSELRKHADGRVDLDRFPGQDTFFHRYTELARQTLDGASLSPTLYVRFTGPTPEPAAGRGPGEPVFLVDIDPSSPDRGVYWPLSIRRSPPRARYIPPDTLQIRVAPGFVLRPSTLYALVVRRSLTSPPLGTALSFEATKATDPRGDPRQEAARKALAPAYEALASLGVHHGDIAALAPFRTHDPAAMNLAIEGSVGALSGEQAPRLLAARWEPGLSRPQGASPYLAMSGVYCTPSYQQQIEKSPFLQGGGQVARDRKGPQLVPMMPGHPSHDPACGPLMRAAFVLTVPLTPPPPGGYPLLVTAHGTGGDARSFLGDDDFAGWAARGGIAVVSTDQPLHGASGPAPRPGSKARLGDGLPGFLGIKLPFELDPPLLFYNPLNPGAARGNQHQALADAAALIRLFSGLDLGATGKVALGPGEPAPPRLRAGPVLLAGHSQGSQSLAALGAISPQVSGVLLSGCGGDTRYGVLANKEFSKFRSVAEAMLGLTPGELDEYHPFLALVQALSDPIDPQTYAARYRSPGVLPPRSVLHVEGLGDSYNPNVAAEALAVALRAAPLAPLPRPVPGLDFLGLAPRPEVFGNASGGRATLAFVQVAPTHQEDGHFVIYHERPLGSLIARFFAETAAGGVPRVAWGR